MATLKEFLTLAGDSDEIIFSVACDGQDPKDVKFIDEYGISSSGRNSEFFVAGFEFGPSVLVHAKGFEAAWGAWIDELPTIPEDELIEAYGIIDDYREEYEKANPPPESLRYNSNNEVSNRWWAAFKIACFKRLKELGEDQANPPELIEGYEYQSNASGTGIVDVGHYAWIREIDPADVTFRIKTKGDADEQATG